LEQYGAVTFAARGTTAAQYLWSHEEEIAATELVRILAYFEYASRQAEADKFVTISLLGTFVWTLRNKILIPKEDDPICVRDVSRYLQSDSFVTAEE
jgi:hypothetical protein